jgi:hypothetical protein
LSKTYFIRHSSALDVDKETLDALWVGDYIGIHYPRDKSGTFHNGDSHSLDPADYEGTSRSCLKRLLNLAKNGGYVFAVYRGKSGGKIGYIEPGSKVELFSGHWGSKNKHDQRQATLKVIKLSKSKNLSAEQSISLKSVQPRQGTFCHWKKVEARVEALLTGITKIELGSLTPDLQEVMCMEYLRSEMARAHGLPVLKYTLSPVGRTLKDLDILGISDNGQIISAQVTYHKLGHADWKLNKLNDYASEISHTIYFCRCDQPQQINGHFVFPIDVVFDEFCKKSEAGQHWFKLSAGA